MDAGVTGAVIAGTFVTVAYLYGLSTWASHRWRIAQHRTAESADGSAPTCSFCGKSQDEVRKLIAGPKVFICDECIDLCNDIIAVESDQGDSRATSPSRQSRTGHFLLPPGAMGLVLIVAVVLLVLYFARR